MAEQDRDEGGHGGRPKGEMRPGAAKPGALAQRLRNYLFAGIIVTAPVSITLYLVWYVLRYFDDRVGQFIPTGYNPETYMPFSLPGIGLLMILALLVLIGWLAAGLVGRTVMHTGEQLLHRTPIVRGIYGTLKQLFETMLSQTSRSFREVVLIEYPRAGIWSLAFVTGEPSGEIARRHGGDLVSVFVPTTPIPAYGFLLFLPRADVVRLDMTVEDGMKLVISGGIVMPPERAPRAPLPPSKPSAGGQQPHGVLPLEEVKEHA
jgi:uncharacterized membrane protein